MATKLPGVPFNGLRIFLVDDEDTIAWAIEQELRSLGAEVRRAASVKQALELFPSFHADLVISDLNLPDGHGLELLKRWRKEEPTMPVILITAHSAIDSAITALRLGAFDYLQKPFDMQALVAAINRAAEVGQLRRRVSQYEGREKSKEPFTIIGESAPMQHLRKMLHRVAKSKADTVLIYGESGSGKELAARAIHDWSDRAQEPFVEVNCASIPESLLESELFGFEKGAFTDARERKYGLFEATRGGTIFLDEIGELPLKLQAKLLRVIEYRRFKRVGGTKDIEFNGRIVAATNRRLEEEISEGRFREDLFYRLDVVPLMVPPLRDRKEDIPSLVDYLLNKICAELAVPVPSISKEALTELENHYWRGNVRELKNSLQRTIIFHQPQRIDVDTLELRSYESRRPSQSEKLPDYADSSQRKTKAETSPAPEPAGHTTAPHAPFVLPPQGINLEDLEKSVLLQALERARYNQTKAAQLLGISRHTLRYRLEKFGLVDAPV